MDRVLNKKSIITSAVFTVIGFLSIATGMYTSILNHYIVGLGLVLLAVVLYLAFVLVVAERNWLDIRAVFSGTWIATIGLAVLRLTDYQEPWQSKTWFLLGLAYLTFEIGAAIGIYIGPGIQKISTEKAKKMRFGKFRFEFQENRLYWICIVTTLIGLVCFLINVKIKGFIPAFSSDVNAYMNFYTKFHVFAVASTGVSGLCYYCIKTQKLSLGKKIILGLCMVYTVIIFPTLVVSRGVFVVVALALTVVVFYMNKRRLSALVLCLVAIMGMYLFASKLRGYTNEQLSYIFQPTQISVPVEQDKEPTTDKQTETGKKPSSGNPNKTEKPSEPEDESETTKPQEEPEVVTFQLSPSASFLYSYLTVSHDNFNLAVKNTQNFTYGLRQFQPFNVILRIPQVEQALQEMEYHIVSVFLTTTNLIGDFYYDFGGFGVGVLMLIWAVVFGVMQSFCESAKGPFSLLIMGNGLVPVALCFFASWLSSFVHWMLWGVVLLFAIFACIKKETTK